MQRLKADSCWLRAGEGLGVTAGGHGDSLWRIKMVGGWLQGRVGTGSALSVTNGKFCVMCILAC